MMIEYYARSTVCVFQVEAVQQELDYNKIMCDKVRAIGLSRVTLFCGVPRDRILSNKSTRVERASCMVLPRDIISALLHHVLGDPG